MLASLHLTQQSQSGRAMEAVLPDAQLGKARASRVCRMKGVKQSPDTKTHTVLPVSGRIQVGVRRLEVGNGENIYQPFTAFKKITARSGWNDQIWVFLHPR